MKLKTRRSLSILLTSCILPIVAKADSPIASFGGCNIYVGDRLVNMQIGAIRATLGFKETPIEVKEEYIFRPFCEQDKISGITLQPHPEREPNTNGVEGERDGITTQKLYAEFEHCNLEVEYWQESNFVQSLSLSKFYTRVKYSENCLADGTISIWDGSIIPTATGHTRSVDCGYPYGFASQNVHYFGKEDYSGDRYYIDGGQTFENEGAAVRYVCYHREQ